MWSLISARLEGLDMTQALRFANKVSSQIVASKGVHLTKEQQEALRTELKQNKREWDRNRSFVRIRFRRPTFRTVE